MPHQYRTSRGAIIEWRTSEAVQTTGTLAPRPQQKFVLRGQGRVARSRVPEAAGADITVSAPAGSLTLTGYAPTVQVSSNQAIQVPAGTLTLTGNAPTVATTANQLIAVPAGALTLTGYAPTVIGDAVSQSPRGRLRRRIKRPMPGLEEDKAQDDTPAEEKRPAMPSLLTAPNQILAQSGQAAEKVRKVYRTKRRLAIETADDAAIDAAVMEFF